MCIQSYNSWDARMLRPSCSLDITVELSPCLTTTRIPSPGDTQRFEMLVTSHQGLRAKECCEFFYCMIRLIMSSRRRCLHG